MGTPNSLDSAVARQPLQIVVTAAGKENLVLRTLTRKAIPLLRHPTPCNRQGRLKLAAILEQALSADLSGDVCEQQEDIPFPPSDPPPDREEPQYEPGCLLEWETGS